MPRDTDALKIRKWAANATVVDGDVIEPENAMPPLDRADGWPDEYSQRGGQTPRRAIFNQLFRELSALAVELNEHGLLEWNATVAYQHPAVVIGSNAMLYVSIQNSTGVDPVGDSDNSHWKPLRVEGAVQASDLAGFRRIFVSTGNPDNSWSNGDLWFKREA